MFNPLDHPICLATPVRIADSAWLSHVPFALGLMDLLRPRVFVELGAFTGVSYCAFCQAASTLQVECRCYAIDTWEGDSHAGFYGQEILQELREHHDPLYGSFSRLVQSTFDAALSHFANSSIDLLHIDGFHSYEEAKSDFIKWLPKMSEKGVVLFHDINVRERDFGLWKLWDEIKSQYPHFSFTHGHGLGILGVGSEQVQPLKMLYGAREPEAIVIREFFHVLGSRVERVAEDRTLGQSLRQSLCEIRELESQLEKNRNYIKRLQEIWSVRFLQVWANEGLPGFFGRTLAKLTPKILPPKYKDWW